MGAGLGMRARLAREDEVTQSSAATAGVRQHLGKVERLDVSQLFELLAATEAVGNDNRVWRC
jgi:hypothetical protein